MRPIEAQLKAIKWESGLPKIIGEFPKCYLDISVYVGEKVYINSEQEENIMLEECIETGNKFYTGIVSVKNFRPYISEIRTQERLLRWYAEVYLFSDYIFFEEKWDEPPF